MIATYRPCPFEDVNHCRIYSKGACLHSQDFTTTILRVDDKFIVFSCKNCKTLTRVMKDAWNRRVNNG